ncbi:MAG: hypothetical protein FWF06_07960 [Symbiobacteriaceae bacterium]|nr:hypothetical protein [Symbiobacteriaceae bacterium]
MEGTKSYPYPKSVVIDTIYDIVELQKGGLCISDATHGKVHYHVSMYGYCWELLYTIIPTGANQCLVTLAVYGDRKDKEKEIRREFALLDSLLEGGAPVKLKAVDTA